MFSMTPVEKYKSLAGLLSLAVYLGVAWALARFFDESVWLALAVLLGARAFFGIVETTAGALNWRLFARRTMVHWFVTILRSNSFPPRFNRRDDFLGYLCDIEAGAFPEALKRAAKEFERLLGMVESQGILAGVRVHSASELALEAYSPKANAPE